MIEAERDEIRAIARQQTKEMIDEALLIYQNGGASLCREIWAFIEAAYTASDRRVLRMLETGKVLYEYEPAE